MKKIFTAALAIASVFAFSSCQKDNIQSSEKSSARISVNYEDVIDSETKAAISEGASSFSLLWSGDEQMYVGTNVNTRSTTFDMVAHSGKTADFAAPEGKDFPSPEPDAEDVDASGTINYFGVVSSFTSSAKGKMRGAIATTQDYAGTDIAKNAFLVGKTADVVPGTSTTMDIKTMNAFVKFSFTKGSPASGSKNTYSKMYVQNIVLEALGEKEYISGRFEISKTEENWYDSYAGVVTANASNKVTLNCVTSENPNGVAVSADNAIDFYLVVAFGEYAKGINVTVTVANEKGEYGEVTKTIGAEEGITIARNTMLRMPALALAPKDLNLETYSLVTDPSKITDGTYYLAGLVNGKYQIWNGTISSGDCVTSEYTYDPESKALVGSGAAEVTLTKVAGSCFKVSVGDRYLLTGSYANRKLKLLDDAEGWTFAIAQDNEKLTDRGFSMEYSGTDLGVFLQSAGNAQSNYLRTYKEFYDNNYGVFLFKKD